MNGVTYDAGALIAAERNSKPVWSLHRELLEREVRPTLLTVVLGQAWRGGPQAQLSRFVRGCRIEPFTEAQARAVGEALAASAGRDSGRCRGGGYRARPRRSDRHQRP